MNDKNNYTGLEIAVIGMAARFPGAKNIDRFWANLKTGVEAISYFSKEELENAGIDPGLIDKPNFVKARGALEDVEYFDAAFFDYTAAEAKLMDPQLRFFHECAYHALENAGYDTDAYNGKIGVYAGASPNLFWEASSYMSGADSMLDPFAVAHLIFRDYMTTRISYKFNLRGPSFLVQAACSTSLVAIHLACQALLSGECTMALAGGASISLPQAGGYLYREGMVKAPDGHCRAFDAGAKGFCGGNGVGAVVLKSLEDAIEDGDFIHAVIKGSAINNDGKQKTGYTAPSIRAQSNLIKAAITMAEVAPESIGYVETHGTGTALGDPIEIKALTRAFNTGKKGFCRIGSVKTNIGHLDAAAGVAGFIKTVLTLKHRQIPPSLFFKQGNPEIDFENSPFIVNARLSDWQNNGGAPRRAGVSSLGIGGTNAHIILEEYKSEIQNSKHETNSNEQNANARNILLSSNIFGGVGTFFQKGSDPPEADVPRSGGVDSSTADFHRSTYQLIVLSAKTPSALDNMTVNLSDYLEKHPDANLTDAAYTLQVGRKAFEYRRMAVCADVADAIAALSAPHDGKVRDFHGKTRSRPVIFMFSGQGSQYVDMGLDLYRQEPLFREEMDRCFAVLEPIMGRDLKGILYQDAFGDPLFEKSGAKTFPEGPAGHLGRTLHRTSSGKVGIIDQTAVAQPLLFIIEYSLAKLAMARGIKPAAMTGHSIGEYTAACLSGVFSLEDALKLVALRGKLMNSMPAGAMLSVAMSEEDLIPLLPGAISLAAVNTTAYCVISGTNDDVDHFEQQLTERDVRCRRLYTSHAFHSAMMEPVLEEFKAALRTIPLHVPRFPFISNLNGAFITAEQAVDPGYWVKHIRSTVRFAAGLTELLKMENAIFVELGPGKTLSTFVRRHAGRKAGHLAVDLLKHPQEKKTDDEYLLQKTGQLWLYGVDIDWQACYRGQKRQRLPLPAYPFEKQRFEIPKDPFREGMAAVPGRGRPLRKPDIADWFYVPSWKRSYTVPGPGGSLSGPVLVFLDRCGVGTRLVERLRQAGHKTITVGTGKRFAAGEKGSYVIDPTAGEHYDRLFTALRDAEEMPAAILHLWTVTPYRNHEKGTMKRVERIQDLGFHSLIHIAQSLGKHAVPGSLHIHVVTAHMQQVLGSDPVCPEKATILGPVKGIPMEYPHISCSTVDISLKDFRGRNGKKERLIERLVEEINADSGDRVTAYRDDVRFAQLFEPLRLNKTGPDPTPLRDKGVYLITGGLGDIGLALAEHLAKSVQAKLVLTGRSAFPPRDRWEQWLEEHEANDPMSEKIGKIRALEAAGAEVLPCSADVTDEKQMRDALSRAAARFGAVNGVIHAAGLADGELMQRRTREKSRRVLAAKVQGAFVLEQILKDKKPDFLILCSSVSSILAPFGQVAYCAANAFLDAFAQQRRQKGSRVTAVNWDRWQHMGMAKIGDRLSRELTGGKITGGISAAEGVEAFSRVLTTDLAQVVVKNNDLRVSIERRNQAGTPDQVKKLAGISFSSGSALRPELTTPYTAPGNETERQFADMFRHFFGIDRVGIHDDFFELGGDSLKAIALTSHISQTYPVSLNDLLACPTISELTALIAERGGSPTQAETAKAGADRHELPAGIELLNKGNSEKNIFIIHPLHGMVNQYKELAVLLAPGYTVYGIQAKGLLPGAPMAAAPGELIADYIRRILAVQEQGPYILAGYCVGNIIAYEIACRLEQMNKRVERLILTDANDFFPPYLVRALHVFAYLPRFVKNIIFSKIDKRVKKKRTAEPRDVEANLRLLTGNILPGGIVTAPLFIPKAEENDHPRATKAYFAKLTKSSARLVEIPGDHDSILKRPYVEKLAESILKLL